MSEYAVTERTRLRRGPKRASYDKATIDAILTEALVCQVACNTPQGVILQPTIHWHDNDYLYLHGSSKNGLFQSLLAGEEATISVTLLDGLVFARSAFHHSVNYRSVTLYARGELIEDEKEKRQQLDWMLEKVRQGRSAEARPANETELKATAVLRFPLQEVSAKIRTGGPVDDPEDMALDVWAGVEPIKQTRETIIYD